MIRKIMLSLAACCAAAGLFAQQFVSWDEAYRQADSLIARLSLDEKIYFARGYSSFFFYGVPEKGIPYLYLSDATQGVHLRNNLPDSTMVRQLERSTAFPCPIMLASSFDPELAFRYAEAVGEECRAGGIEVLLGPGLNIARNSQCGRNFEYFGEDPLLTSVMAAAYVRGMQSTGTAACLKHFIGNETEFYRRRSNSLIDERALHEIYMPPFRAGIEAGVAYVMTSYNQLNGEWAGQNSRVIGELLRGELGFRGCVMSDWSSVYDTEKVVKSGQNVEMPGRREFVEEVRELLRQGCISEKDLERMIRPNVATAVAFGLYDRVKYRPDLLRRLPAFSGGPSVIPALQLPLPVSRVCTARKSLRSLNCVLHLVDQGFLRSIPQRIGQDNLRPVVYTHQPAFQALEAQRHVFQLGIIFEQLVVSDEVRQHAAFRSSGRPP